MMNPAMSNGSVPNIGPVRWTAGSMSFQVKIVLRDPRVSALLSVLKPTEACEEFARHRYIQALIQRA